MARRIKPAVAIKVRRQPIRLMRNSVSGIMINAPNPWPMLAMPMAVARRRTNQKEISALWPTNPSAP